MIAKIALPVACFALMIHLFMLGMAPGANAPRACTMDGPGGKSVPFHLTTSAQTMVVDLGEGDVYAFPVNRELSDSKFQVAAARERGGSVSILLDQTNGDFQETILTAGRAPDFLYGKCALR